MKLPSPILCILALVSMAVPARSQSAGQEYYRRFWFDADERIHFCSRADSVGGEYEIFGVERDTLGRPVTVTRYFYRNIDTRADWAIMRIGYVTGKGGNLLVRRTFHAPNGMPVPLGSVMAEEALYRAGKDLMIRRTVDSAGELVNDTSGVSQSIFRAEGGVEPAFRGMSSDPSGPRRVVVQQAFFYGAGKQHFGTDLPWRPFAPLPKGAYFRNYVADSGGNLLREELLSFAKKPLPFPGGEYARRYKPGECGLPERVEYLDADGAPTANAEGIASERFAYDDRGRIVGWEAFDLNGDPAGRSSDGAARLERSYRAIDGELVAERKFDGRGRPIATP
jgi:hypothetical protein